MIQGENPFFARPAIEGSKSYNGVGYKIIAQTEGVRINSAEFLLFGFRIREVDFV